MGNEESLAPAEHGQRLNGGNLNAACPFIAEYSVFSLEGPCAGSIHTAEVNA